MTYKMTPRRIENYMNNINDPKHPVVFFIPEVGIYPYIRGLAVLGDAIIKRGGKVLITHDTGQMLRSPMMVMHKLRVNASPKEKAAIYKITERYFKSVLEKYKFLPIELSEFVNAQLMKDINALVDNDGNNLQNIVFRGFPIGKMAENDFILETKFPYYPKLSSLHKALYIQYIKNTALTIAITDNICERYKPSLLFTFNEYAQGQAVRHSADTHNVARLALTYPVHFNIDASRFSIWKYTYRRWFTNHCQKWNNWKNIAISKKHVVASWDDSIFRMYNSGSHIFSSRKNNDPALIFNNLKLDSKRKTVVVYTSSQEERSCAGIAIKIWKEDDRVVDAFSNQIEWLSMLRKYASSRKDIQIIVRVHPREGSRQFGFESQHLKKLKKKFKKNTSTFIVVWPDDPISSYDLIELADVCLVSWSTIGQEMARLGMPVLSCVGNMFYPDDDFIQVATTPKEYKKKLDAILNIKYSWQHLIKAVRFYHWRTFIPSLDLGETVPKDFDDDAIWPKAPTSKVGVINDILSGKQDLIEYNIKQWQKSLTKNAISQETVAMKKGIRHLLDKIYYSPPAPKKTNILFLILRRIWHELTGKNLSFSHSQIPFNDYHLKYTEDISKLNDLIKETKNNPTLRVLVATGSQAILVHNGKLLNRMSPMVIRLARLHEYN